MSGADALCGAFPSNVDNSLRLTAIYLRDSTDTGVGLRGVFPGVLYSPQTGMVATLGAPPSVIAGQGELAGRNILSYPCSQVTNGSVGGKGFYDITGPWR